MLDILSNFLDVKVDDDDHLMHYLSVLQRTWNENLLNRKCEIASSTWAARSLVSTNPVDQKMALLRNHSAN